MGGGQVVQTPRPSVHFDATRTNPNIAPHFDGFVSNELFFDAQDGHRLVEIGKGPDGKLIVTESVLREQEISEWLHQVWLQTYPLILGEGVDRKLVADRCRHKKN
jgi:hypothetical protein